MKKNARDKQQEKQREKAEEIYLHAGAFGLTVVAHLLKDWPLEGVNKGRTGKAAVRVNYFTFIVKHMLLFAMIDKFRHDAAKGSEEQGRMADILMNMAETRFFAARDQHSNRLEHAEDSPFETGPFTPFAGTTLENLSDNKELANTPVLEAARMLAREFNRPGDQTFLDRAKVLGLSAVKQLLSVSIHGAAPKFGVLTRTRIFCTAMYRYLTGRA